MSAVKEMASAGAKVTPFKEPRAMARTAVSALSGLAFGLMVSGGLLLVVLTQLLDWHMVTISSESMAPRLHRGDLVLVRPVPMADLEERDIVFYREVNTGLPFVHRVVGINQIRTHVHDGETGEYLGTSVDYRLVTKGDANRGVDPGEVTAEQYEGKVILTVPTFGLADRIPFQVVLLLMAGVFGAAWMGWEFVVQSRRPGKRRKRRRRKKAGRPAEGAPGAAGGSGDAG